MSFWLVYTYVSCILVMPVVAEHSYIYSVFMLLCYETVFESRWAIFLCIYSIRHSYIFSQTLIYIQTCSIYYIYALLYLLLMIIWYNGLVHSSIKNACQWHPTHYWKTFLGPPVWFRVSQSGIRVAIIFITWLMTLPIILVPYFVLYPILLSIPDFALVLYEQHMLVML